MKKIFAWLLRICCFVLIGAAAYTLIGCIRNVNEDYSKDAIMARRNETVQTTQVSTPETVQSTTEPSATPAPVMPETSNVEEDPTVVLSADGTATVNRPTVSVTASFGNIVNSITADLKWYLDDELVYTETGCLVVEGATKTYQAKVDVDQEGADTAQVRLEVSFQDKLVDAETQFPVERMGAGDSIVIRTEEITVTARRDSGIYSGSDLSGDTGDAMAKSDTGLLLAYETNNSGLSALKLKFTDGSEGWVDAADMDITDENCTTDEDYTDDQKMDFVNNMNYDSYTEYLVWVSLYTQKVNVFSGYEGHWTLIETFDCSSGVNETPTTTGVFQIQSIRDRWDLGRTYVEPVLVFNGGEAFTSRPYSTETNEITDETMGEPASGGSIRMLDADIAWMADNIPINTMVVVY